MVCSALSYSSISADVMYRQVGIVLEELSAFRYGRVYDGSGKCREVVEVEREACW